MVQWYKYAQNQDLYQQLSDMGISFNNDGSLNIYNIDESGSIDFHTTPKRTQSIEKAISQQYLIYGSLQDELNKYLAFIDDLVLLVEKLNKFPVLDIPEATEKLEPQPEGQEEQIEEQPTEEQPFSTESEESEGEIEEAEEIGSIDESTIDQPYPFTPQDEKAQHPQYGYWYYPFDPNQHQEKTPEEIEEDLKNRDELELTPFSEQDEVIPSSEMPQNVDIVNQVEEVVNNITTTSSEDAQNIAAMIRKKYVYPLTKVKDELKIEIRDRFEGLARSYENLNFSDSLNIVNMATRVRMEKDIRAKFESMIAFLENRITKLEEFLNAVKQGQIQYNGKIEDINSNMMGYEAKRQNNNIFSITKPRSNTVYYVDVANKVCTCPWGKKVSPYKYEASACKHYAWIADLVRKNLI